MSRINSDRSPKVTGLSPKEGIPGTKIVIRGENLGEGPDDLIGLTICGVDCVMFAEWKTSNKILARSGRCDGLGDVVVTTISGGVGSCTVQFKGLPDIISPTKDCSVWINEEEYFSLSKVAHSIGGITGPVFYSSDLLNLSNNSENEGSKSAIAENVIREFFPEVYGQDKSERGFGNPYSRDFIPAWYLLENHSSTSFDDLIRGFNNLKNKIDQKTTNSSLGPKALLKPHVLPIVDCLDALKSVQLNIKQQKQILDLGQKIEEEIKRVLAESHEIYDPVLARKDSADSTRNALNVLQRYRFLFNLPSSTERYIENREYDNLINDYSRAKSRFADAQVPVFRQVYLEVEKRIDAFRRSLQDKLAKQCADYENRNVEEVKKLVQYLISLEVPGNPAWETLVAIKENLLKEMEDGHNKYIEIAKIPVIITKEPSNLFSEEDETASQRPLIIQFIEELTLTFNQSFADLVKLGTYFLDNDFNFELGDSEDRDQVFYSEMIQKPLKYCVALIRYALLPNTVPNMEKSLRPWPSSATNNESFFVWLPRCLKISCDFYQKILDNPLPSNAVQPLQQLITDLRIHSLVTLFNQAADEVKNLHLDENWAIVSDDSLGTRTALPILFENKVVEVLLLVREHVIQTTCPDEVDIFSKINVQGQMKQLAQNLLLAFLSTLEKVYKSIVSQSIETPTSNTELDREDKILALICNYSYTTNQVLPRLHENFDKYNYPDMTMVMKVVQNRYKELESKLFTHFVESKCDSVINTLKPSMYTVANEWYTSAVRPSDVSYYVKEIVLAIVEVQAKIYLVAPCLVRKMVTQLIEATLEEIATLFQSVSDRLTDAGNVHASVDLSALEHVFADADNFESPKAEKLLNLARARLKSLSNPQDNKLANKLLSRFKTSMQLQLLCFKWATDGQTVIAI